MPQLLTVCTGNICRSAFAKAYLDRELSEWDVDSAGTSAYHRLDVPQQIHDLAGRHGLDLSTHRAQPITEVLLRPLDLVLTATVEQRGEVLSMWPRGLRRAFTFVEASRIIETVGRQVEPGLPAQERVGFLAAHRRDAANSGDLDVPDPYGGPDEGYAAMERAMVPHLDRIVEFLNR